MDYFNGIFVFSLFFQIFGNVNGQAGGGVPLGLGLGGDFMVDTAFGELPSPFVAMATQGNQGTNPAPQTNPGVQTDLSQALHSAAENSGTFNPGTNLASEFSAQSGTAVDMSSFLPPPFGESPTSTNSLLSSGPELPPPDRQSSSRSSSLSSGDPGLPPPSRRPPSQGADLPPSNTRQSAIPGLSSNTRPSSGPTLSSGRTGNIGGISQPSMTQGRLPELNSLSNLLRGFSPKTNTVSNNKQSAAVGSGDSLSNRRVTSNANPISDLNALVSLNSAPNPRDFIGSSLTNPNQQFPIADSSSSLAGVKQPSNAVLSEQSLMEDSMFETAATGVKSLAQDTGSTSTNQGLGSTGELGSLTDSLSGSATKQPDEVGSGSRFGSINLTGSRRTSNQLANDAATAQARANAPGADAQFSGMIDNSRNSGLGGGLITNLVGVEPGKVNSGGMGIPNFNTRLHDLNTMTGGSQGGDKPPMSSFVIGAGNPNAKVIGKDVVTSVNEQSSLNVGGAALGSGLFDFGRISLPANALAPNKAEEKKPTLTKTNPKVDMSSFLPPPYESDGLGAASNTDIQMGVSRPDQNVLKVNRNQVKEPTNMQQGTSQVLNQSRKVQQQLANTRSTPLTDVLQSAHGRDGRQHTGPSSQPVVGSIFGATESTSSNILTQRFLEKSGLTREPDVGFMTTFLNNAKPSRATNRGNENVQIVPFGSDISTIGTQSNNIIVGRNDANSVGQFGVADIYTRQQQLNPSQWKELMSKVSQEAQNAPTDNVNYQTQNLISASETKPLADSLTLRSPTRNSPPSSSQTFGGRSAAFTRESANDITKFAAPGMTGHKSVTIPSIAPRQAVRQTSFSIDSSASSATTGNRRDQPQPGQRNPTDLSSDTFRRQTTVQDGREFSTNLQGSSRPRGILPSGLNNNQATIQNRRNNQAVSESGQRIQDEMQTFNLGQSILVSDGTVPEFTRPGGSGQITAGGSPNVQTLGQPAVQSNRNAVNLQQTRSLQSGGRQNLLLQGNSQGLLAGVQSPDASRSLSVQPLVTAASQTGQMTDQMLTVDSASTSSGGNVLPTLYTSGNRLAVFGPANDVSGRLINARQAKPVPATRVGVLAPVTECRYSPDPSSEYYFIYKNGLTQHRFRCALGTAFDEMTCECSIRVSDHGDCLEVHMDFNEGVVADSSLNRLPIGNENVEVTNSTSPIPGIALFGGDSKLTIWRYQNYDFRDHVMLKVQFRPGVGGQRYQPLISNCDGGAEGPSMAIIYDNINKEVVLLLKTDNDTRKELTFAVNPDEWNDVTYIYDGQEFIGIVNGVRRYVSKENPHLLGIIGGVIKSAPTQGLVEIRDAAIVLGHCPMYGYFRGAMVDIQIYTCIPKDFRLE